MLHAPPVSQAVTASTVVRRHWDRDYVLPGLSLPWAAVRLQRAPLVPPESTVFLVVQAPLVTGLVLPVHIQSWARVWFQAACLVRPGGIALSAHPQFQDRGSARLELSLSWALG